MGHKYTSIDIVRSDYIIKSDSDLEKEVISQIDDLNEYKSGEKRDIKEFYNILDEKLKNIDRKGAKIDLSTLALAAARKADCEEIGWLEAYRAVKADQQYQLKKNRENKLVVGRIYRILNKLEKINQYFQEKDLKTAKKTAFDTTEAYIMKAGSEIKDTQIEGIYQRAENFDNHFANLNKASKKANAKSRKPTTNTLVVHKKFTKETHPDIAGVPEGYVEDEWLVDCLIQDIFDKLDSEDF